ncbi:MAG: hypothetical protein ABIR32_19660 [Ilumatobacteraceae bacterium]
MITTPGGPYPVADRDGLLCCFDETAAGLFTFICRLVGGERGIVEPLLANVYIRISDQTAADAAAFVNAASLHAVAVATATEVAARRWGGDGSEVRERALIDLGIVDDRTIDEISAVVALPSADVAVRLDSLRRRYNTREDAEQQLRVSELWFDDDTRSRIRLAVGVGSLVAIDAADMRHTEVAPGWDVASFTTDYEAQRQTPAAPTPDERRPSRRLKVGAALGIAAVLTAGFFWVTPNRESPPDEAALTENSTGTTATTDAPETKPAPTTTADDAPTITVDAYERSGLQLSPGFILTNVPAGWRIGGLWESLADEQVVSESSGGWFQLWAEPGATRTTGRWLALATSFTPGHESFVDGDRNERFAGPGYRGLLQVTNDGVEQMTLEVGAGLPLRVSTASFGLSDDDLIAIATSMERLVPPSGLTIGNRRAQLQPSSVGMARLVGMEVIEAGPSSCCGLYGISRPADQRSVQYNRRITPTDDYQAISIHTRDSLDRSELDRFVDPFSIDPTAAPTSFSTSIEQVGDRLVHFTEYTSGPTTGRTTGQTTATAGLTTAWWSDQSQLVMVYATFSAADLEILIGSIRRASDDEWLQADEDARTAPSVGENGDEYVDPMSTRRSLGPRLTGDGLTYELFVNDTGTAAEINVRSSSSGSSTGWGIGWTSERPVTEFESVDATLLIVSMPTQPAGSSVRVTVPGREPKVIELRSLAEADASVAFDAFSELPPYTIELLDATGTVVQVLTP